MAIKYPLPNKNKINNKTITASKINSHGMMFENALNISNEYYLSKNIANIHKKPTPIQVVKVDYPQRSASKIVEAYYKIPSTTDYNGIYRGKYIDYEAKETTSNLFSFTHIYKHQVEHLLSVKKLGGIAFIIIYYKSYDEIFIIDIDVFNNLYVNGPKKSISHDDAEKIGLKIKTSYAPPIDYLKAVDILIDNNSDNI